MKQSALASKFIIAIVFVAAGCTKSPPEPAKTWSYSQSEDKLRGTVDTFATATSAENDEGRVANLTIRQRSVDGLSILVESSGSDIFDCMTICEGVLKFDENPPKTFHFVPPQGGMPSVIFSTSDERGKLLKKIKEAKHVTMELNFLNKGRRQFEFNIAGLKDN